MELLKCETSDIENSEKYIFKDGEKEIGYGYIKSIEINPIEIFIYEKERSYGYGKLLFSKLFDIIKEKTDKVLVFELPEEQYRMINIVASFGGRYISIKDGIRRYILPIKHQ